jgi:phosphomannomutase
LILHLLAESGQTVSGILASLPPYAIVKEKLACPSHKIKDALRMVEREYEGYTADRRDGVKIMLPDGWFLVRGSNTEPIIRVVAEGPTEERAREIINHIFTQVRVAVTS